MTTEVQISELRYADAGGRRIDMTVTGWFDEPIPFTYDPADRAPLTETVRPLIEQGGIAVAPFVPK